jgi:hypothetical protein
MGPGHIHWSIKALKEDRGGIRSRLRTTYAENAIPPASPWLGNKAPGPVYVAPVEKNGGLTLSFKAEPDARWRVIQVRKGNNWSTLRMIPAAQETIQLENAPSEVAIRHISPSGMISIPTVLKKQ